MSLVNLPTDYPHRIVCLTEEPTEVLYLLGEGDRVVGVSGYTVRPPEARQKPKVSAFTTAKYDKILDLQPDLVIGFSDLQAEIARELIGRGVPVIIFNQRSVAEILQMTLMIGGLVGCSEKAEKLVASFRSEIDGARRKAASLPRRPRVYFEEWMDPLISGIRWVEELIEIAGGQSTFPELRERCLAKDRIISPDEVIRRDPELIVASWCGKRVNTEAIRGRPGWSTISAVKNDRIHEIKSAHILQPGPAAITEGLSQLSRLIRETAEEIAGE